MNEAEHLQTVRIKLWKYGLLSAFAFLPPLIAFLYPAMPVNETTATWFQRSGSLMVVIALLVEFKLFSIQAYFDLYNTAMYVPVDIPKIYRVMYICISTFAALTMVLGTLIWGYGDIIIKNT